MKNISAFKDENSGRLIHDPKKLPTVMNKHFSSCGPILAAKLPHSERHFSEYFDHSCQKSFYFNPVTPAEIKCEISLLPIGRSHRAYSTIILKVAKLFISKPFMDIMNASISEGTYSDKLKLAKVVPIFKSGDDSDTNNYCPISLLSIFNRIFEKLMYKRLKSFF